PGTWCSPRSRGGTNRRRGSRTTYATPASRRTGRTPNRRAGPARLNLGLRVRLALRMGRVARSWMVVGLRDALELLKTSQGRAIGFDEAPAGPVARRRGNEEDLTRGEPGRRIPTS